MSDIIFNHGKDRSLTSHIIKIIKEAKVWIKACNLFFDDAQVKKALEEACSRGVALFILTNLQGTSHEKNKNKKKGKANVESQSSQNFAHADSLSDLYNSGAHISGLDGLHAKFLLVDGVTGVLTSANFTHNSTSKISEIGVCVSGDDFDDLEEIFDLLFVRPDKFHFANNETHFTYERPVEPIDPEALRPSERIRMTLASTDRGSGRALEKCDVHSLKDEIIDIINSAQPEEDLCLVTYSFVRETDNGKNGAMLKKALSEAKDRGVNIRIVMRAEKPDNKGNAKTGRPHTMWGIPVTAHPDNHAKVVMTGNRGILFTGNLTEESFQSGFDLGILLDADQMKDTANFIGLLIQDTQK